MYFIISLILIFLDQIIKFICTTKLKPMGSVNIIENFFRLTYVENRGAAFGILQNNQIFFILVAFLAISLCIFYFFKSSSVIYKTTLILIMSGAIGNLIDRLFRGYVVDMFHFTFFGKDFAVFNCADIYIVLGIFILFLITFFKEKGKNNGNF